MIEQDVADEVDRDDRADSRVGLMKLAWVIVLIAGVLLTAWTGMKELIAGVWLTV